MAGDSVKKKGVLQKSAGARYISPLRTTGISHKHGYMAVALVIDCLIEARIDF